MRIVIQCKKEEKLGNKEIKYVIMATLEAEADLPIYQEVEQRVRIQEQMAVRVRN